MFFDTNVLVYATAKDDARAATAITLLAGGGVAERDGMNICDALIVASALEARCRTLLSEDMQDGRVIDRSLTIRNPFGARAGPI